jgi:hypothetical protein
LDQSEIPVDRFKIFMAEFTSLAARGKSKKCANRLDLSPSRAGMCDNKSSRLDFLAAFLCYFDFVELVQQSCPRFFFPQKESKKKI